MLTIYLLVLLLIFIFTTTSRYICNWFMVITIFLVTAIYFKWICKVFSRSWIYISFFFFVFNPHEIKHIVPYKNNTQILAWTWYDNKITSSWSKIITLSNIFVIFNLIKIFNIVYLVKENCLTNKKLQFSGLTYFCT